MQFIIVSAGDLQSILKGQYHKKSFVSTTQRLFEINDQDGFSLSISFLILEIFVFYNILLKLICDIIYSRIRNEIYQTKNISQRSWRNSSDFYTDMLLCTNTPVKFE